MSLNQAMRYACYGLLGFSTAQWPVAYLLDLSSNVSYLTGLSILALQFAALAGIAGAAPEDQPPKE